MRVVCSRFRPPWIAVMLAFGSVGLTSCSDLWRGKREVVEVPDPAPMPPAPLPDPKKPDGPEKPPVVAPPAESGVIPIARAVPGRPGFVFSPYNNKLVDVEGFPSGRLVADPHYPTSEKKYFRVP